MKDEVLLSRINNHPKLKASIEKMLDIAESSSGTLIKADDAEEAVVKEIREVGHELLQTWAVTQQALAEEATKMNKVHKVHSKKNLHG